MVHQHSVNDYKLSNFWIFDVHQALIKPKQIFPKTCQFIHSPPSSSAPADEHAPPVLLKAHCADPPVFYACT